MIVRKVTLKNWGVHRETIEVEFSEGLNIVHGKNEAGKTTLIDSIRTVLFTKHKSHSEKIRSLIPWGSTLSPEACITFVQGGDYFRITKRFISSEMSQLEKLVSGKWERIAEGDMADKRVVEIVGGKLPGRGDTKPELWGVGQALWMVQGVPFVDGDLNEETLTSLKKLIGAVVETEEEKKLFKKLDGMFSSIFTGVRREIKRGHRIKILQDKIEKLSEELARSIERKEKKEEIKGEIEELKVRLKIKEEKLKKLQNERDELKLKVEKAEEHRRNRERLEEEIKRLLAEFDVLKDRIKGIYDSRKKIEALEVENRSLVNKKKELQEKLSRLLDEIEESENSITETVFKIEDVENFLKEARIFLETLQKKGELEEKKKVLEEIEVLEKEFAEKEKIFMGLNAPSDAELAKIEQIYQKKHDIKTKLYALGLKTRIEAFSDFSGKTDLDGEITGFFLKKGESKVLKSHEYVRVEIEGIGSFEVRSGSQDVKGLKTELESLEREYDKLCAPFGTGDLDKLKRSLLEKKLIEKEIKNFKKMIKKQAKEGRASLKRRIAILEKVVDANLSKISLHSIFEKEFLSVNDPFLLHGEIETKIKKKDEELSELKEKLKQFDAKKKELQKRAENFKEEIYKVDRAIYNNNGRISEINLNLQRLKSYGDVEELENRLNRLSVELDRKQRALAEYENSIEEAEKEPLQKWKAYESAIDRLQKSISEIKEKLAEQMGKLSTIAGSSVDTTRLSEEIEYLKNEKDSLETEAKAVMLLHDIMDFYRKKSVENLTYPVQKLMKEDLVLLFGKKYKEIKFDDKIKPTKVEVSTWGVDAPLQLLSFGTKEQIWFIFRLALGRLLSLKERQLVVLDDPLANTDPGRMFKALQILEKRANELQIIVITCDPDKYMLLQNANFIPIEKAS